MNIKDNNKFNVLIGTPAYEGKVNIEFCNTIMDFMFENIPCTLFGITNESLITRARNTIISYAYNNQSKYSHLLFLDGDIRLHPGSLSTLLSHNKSVIGAPVRLKGTFNEKNMYNIENIKELQNDLCEVDKVGTGVLLLDNLSIKSLCESSDIYEKKQRSDRGIQINEKQYDVFQVGVIDNNYLSEDYMICHKLKKLGYTLYIDKSIKSKHFGMYEF